jgi:hypothetical protein
MSCVAKELKAKLKARVFIFAGDKAKLNDRIDRIDSCTIKRDQFHWLDFP